LVRPPAIFSIGYEGLVQSQLIDLLFASRVALVLDVRAIAASRKAGFSKQVLASSLQAAGIDYRHDRRLGTPKPGRQASRAGKTAEMAAIFSTHMTTPEAITGLADAVIAAQSATLCLLCFERAPHDCHRSILAGMIRRKTGQDIRHL
jgi:uncharacterized protein (DUF488 family)